MKYLVILFYFSFLTLQAQSIVINEIVPKNVISFQEKCVSSGCPDWIELRNTTNAAVNIGQYYLSDDALAPMKWQFPSGTEVPANGYLILFSENASSSASPKLNFNLSSLGETLVLSDASGVEIQQVSFPETQNDVSYGRLANGSYSFFENPTPNASNDELTSFQYTSSELSINLPSGLYSGAQSIELTQTGNGSIYYTIDGSTPTVNSSLYTTPISINENTVLKARVIENANLISIVENRSYVIDANHDLPVILLTSDNSSRPPFRKNKEVVDGRVEFVFVESDGTTVISQYANFRESGNASRFIIPQLNGKIEAHKLYGDGDFDHKIFPEKNITSFKKMLLRNSSQDWLFTHIRDAYVSRLLGKDNLVNIPFEGFRPAALYVNSIYQGIIHVREDDDGEYIKSNFGLKSGDFQEGVGAFIDLQDPLPSDRESVDSVINFNNFTNLNLLSSYVDLGEIGFRWWEDLSGKTGQRFHYFMHDYDVSFGRVAGDVVSVTEPMDVSGFLENEILSNTTYKNEALQFVAAALNHLYNSERALGILDEIQTSLESEIAAHGEVNDRLNMERMPSFSTTPFINLSEWEDQMAVLRNNVENRIDADIFNRIQTEYNLDSPIEISYNSSDITHGFVRVHEIEIQKQNSKGTYFSNIPIKFSAEALPGYKFVRWEGDIDETDVAVAPVFSSSASVTAVFEPVTFASNNLVINEVQGKNSTTIADENGEFNDWIEIYNPESIPVNIANTYFSDDPSEPLKWIIPDTDSSRTTVPSNGYLLLWADNDPQQGENHLGFKLKRSGSVVWTNSDAATQKQLVDFTDIEEDKSFGAETDGSSIYVLFDTPTPNASNDGSVNLIEDTDAATANFLLYPNPSSSLVFIKSENSSIVPLNWVVHSLEGKKLKEGQGNIVDMEAFDPGLYLITINQVETLKIVNR